jgi:hypothetical protein
MKDILTAVNPKLPFYMALTGSGDISIIEVLKCAIRMPFDEG